MLQSYAISDWIYLGICSRFSNRITTVRPVTPRGGFLMWPYLPSALPIKLPDRLVRMGFEPIPLGLSHTLGPCNPQNYCHSLSAIRFWRLVHSAYYQHFAPQLASCQAFLRLRCWPFGDRGSPHHPPHQTSGSYGIFLFGVYHKKHRLVMLTGFEPISRDWESRIFVI